MVNSVNSSSAVAQLYIQQQHHAAKPQPPAKEAQKPDTVELSPKATQAAAGDVDHDGDRH